MDDQGNNPPPKESVTTSLKDQLFLLDFVMRTYLGPDVFSDNPRCSASQRLAKGLSPYTSKNLGTSFLSVSQLESLYYYLLRDANSSLILEPSMLHMYIKGQLPLLEYSEYGQFTSYFPMNIHEHKRYSPSHEIVKGIVLIDDPSISDLKEEDLKRFRCLSGIDSLRIGKMKSLCYQRRSQEVKENDCYQSRSNEVTDVGTTSTGNDNFPENSQAPCERNKDGKENDQNHPISNEVTAAETISTGNDISPANSQGSCERNKEGKENDGNHPRSNEVTAARTTSPENENSPVNSQAPCESNKEGKENDHNHQRSNEVTAAGPTSTGNDNCPANSQAPCERNREDIEIDHNHPRSNEVTAAGTTSTENDNAPAKSQAPCKRSMEETVMGNITNGSGNSPSKFQETYKRRRQGNPLRVPAFSSVASHQKPEIEESTTRTSKTDKPTTTSLVTEEANMEEYAPDASLTLNGTAKKGIFGPPVGVVDIGVSKTAYFFRVALPGVRRDYCQFSCEIECDGKVILQGTTTGGKTIKRGSRVFQMKFQQLCPPGSFTLSFHLPGPVDPRLLSPNFKPDGVFEAVIVKHKSQ